jgi:DNA ligase-1
MPDLDDGQSVEMQGSGKKPYVLKNTGGVYSCTCPAWRNQSLAIEKRTCKHLRKLRGDAAETERVGNALPVRAKSDESDEAADKGPPILLAHVWENDVDLAGWWMSEKLDGVRAYWDGKRFLSRLGNEFHAPDWFVAGLPDTPLDGELWLARKAFQQTVSIVRRQDKSDHWKQIRYVVFDAPAQTDPFEERLAFLADRLGKIGSDFVVTHEHARCKNLEHLRAELERVEALGGEGLMLRQPGSKYEAGRSTTLLKVKNFHDADAVVVEHVAGKGRHKGRLGALVVKMPDGTEFSVGTGFSDKERESPPAIGSTITYRYQELSTGGVPRFPSFVRARREK